jgi:hypothetical protein
MGSAHRSHFPQNLRLERKKTKVSQTPVEAASALSSVVCLTILSLSVHWRLAVGLSVCLRPTYIHTYIDTCNNVPFLHLFSNLVTNLFKQH